MGVKKMKPIVICYFFTMHQEKEYKCQSCFQNNSVSIEMTFCSETVDVIEDCTVCCNPNSISYTVENEKVVYFEVVKTY